MEAGIRVWGLLIAVLAAVAIYRHARGTAPIKSKVLVFFVILFTWSISIPAYVLGDLMKRRALKRGQRD